MNKYWRVKSRKVAEALEKYNADFKNATDELLNAIQEIMTHDYAEGIDPNNIGTAVSTFGTAFIAVKFTILPPEKYWRCNTHPFYVPKSVNPFYKKFRELSGKFPSCPINELLGIPVIRNDGTIVRAGFEKLGDEWFVTTDDKFKGNAKVERISDLQLEELRAKSKKGKRK